MNTLRNFPHVTPLLVLALAALAGTGCPPVASPPQITSDPVSQTVSEGASASFAVAVTGTAPFSYQWRKDGVNIPGANVSNYQIPSVHPSDAGSYDCLITNTAGSIWSDAATLTVVPPVNPPVITTQPVSQTYAPPDTVTVAVTVSGTPPFTYQWAKDGVAITGATAASYVLNDTLLSDEGAYTCRIANAGGNATSAAATLTVSADYLQGFDEGFAVDDWYWTGYADSFDTVGFSPMYYQGGTIQYVDTPVNDRGYWDGVWYAYNDGYFVAYDYAFSIGFSEGYDAAFFADYLNFLDNDVHVEYDNGGWSDGYNDGFSEGRVFGANDYEQGLTFDWLDALLDYQSGTDLNFAEIGVGTGAYGPVTLYVYGTDPTAAKNGVRRADPAWRSIRGGNTPAKAEKPALSYRPLTATAQDELRKAPTTAARSARPLTLKTTWLNRVDAYRAAIQVKANALHPRNRLID